MEDIPIRSNVISSSIQSFEQLLQAKLNQQQPCSRPSTANHHVLQPIQYNLLNELNDTTANNIDETSLCEFAELEAQLQAELNDDNSPQPTNGNLFSQIVSEYESTFNEGIGQYDEPQDITPNEVDVVPNLSTIIEEDHYEHNDVTINDLYDEHKHNDAPTSIDTTDAVIIPSNLVQKYFMSQNDGNSNTRKAHSRSNSQHNTASQPPPATPQSMDVPLQYNTDMIDQMKLLESEILKYKNEQNKLKQIQHEEQTELNYIRNECNAAKQRLHTERLQFDEYKTNELKRIKKLSVDIMSKQRKLTQQPERSERKQVDSMKLQINALTDELQSTNDKYKIKVTALKKSIDLLTNENMLLKQELNQLQKQQYIPSSSTTANTSHVLQPPKTAPHSNITPNKSMNTNNTTRRTSHSTVSSKNGWTTSPPKSIDKLTIHDSTSHNNTINNKLQHSTSHQSLHNNHNSTNTVSSAGKLIQSIEHSGGKHEKVYSDGTRIIEFPNGTNKHIYSSGEVLVEFINGDTKRIYSNGNILYYYSTVNTTHLTEKSGIQYYRFDNGQIEKHDMNNEKWIYYTDMTVKHILSDGQEEIRPIRSQSEIPQF